MKKVFSEIKEELEETKGLIGAQTNKQLLRSRPEVQIGARVNYLGRLGKIISFGVGYANVRFDNTGREKAVDFDQLVVLETKELVVYGQFVTKGDITDLIEFEVTEFGKMEIADALSKDVVSDPSFMVDIRGAAIKREDIEKAILRGLKKIDLAKVANIAAKDISASAGIVH